MRFPNFALEVDVKAFRLGKHLFLFLSLSLFVHAFCKNRELGFAVIAVPGRAVELRDQNLGDMMLLVSFVHELRANVLADGRIEDLFFENGVNLEFGEHPGRRCSPGRRRLGLSNWSKRSLTVS